MNNLKTIGLTFLMVFSVGAFAQEKTSNSVSNDSEIVMTKAELESFLKTVADARRAQLRKAKEERKQRELAKLREEYNNLSARHYAGNGYTNNDIIRELNRLNARIDQLSANRYNVVPGNGSNSSTIIVPGSNGTQYVPAQQQPYTQYVPTQQVPKNNYVENNQRIQELEKQIDSLKAVQTGFKTVVVQPKGDSAKLADLQQQFNALNARLEAQPTPQTPQQRRDMLEDLLNKFSNFKKQVFFANNSDKLSTIDYAYIQDVTKVLIDYPELSVVLEGWASPRGNAEYNKQLSMRRAESVERALLNNGISPVRIVSSFRGEDHSTSAAMARRVDMSIILK